MGRVFAGFSDLTGRVDLASDSLHAGHSNSADMSRDDAEHRIVSPYGEQQMC